MNRPVSSQSLRHVALTMALVATGVANAGVGPAGTLGSGGGMENVAYGDAGNVFQLEPMLFVQGLGGHADDPVSVATLNPLLEYSFAVSGEGTDLMTVDYRVRNTSASESFNDLRLMVFTNPDGDSINYLDVLSETWGAAAAGDPVRREGRAFTDPTDTLLADFQLNNNLTEGFDALCQGASGCDATVGLQWDAALLGPGETFLVRLGLSDSGKHLSSRWIDAVAVDSANTVLTLSGVSSIVAVPVPAAAWLFVSGMAMLGRAARRRQS